MLFYCANTNYFLSNYDPYKTVLLYLRFDKSSINNLTVQECDASKA